MNLHTTSSKQYTAQEVADGVNAEGLGYWLLDYTDPAKIEDPQLREFGIAAEKALNQFKDRLTELLGDDWQE
jgi:hypothetical protein